MVSTAAVAVLWLRHDQSRNQLEVSRVTRRHRVALLNGRSADRQIVERDCDPSGGLLAADAPDDLGGLVRNWMHRNVTLQIVNEHPPPLLSFWRIRPVDTMHQLGHGHCADGDLHLTCTLANLLQEIFHCLSLALRVDDHAGIEDQSQERGFHGCWRLLIPSSTSAAKPPSSVTLEPLAFAEAIHSEIGRPERRGGRMIATGRWSCSTTISAPCWSFSSTAPKLLVTSASVMRTCSILLMIRLCGLRLPGQR